MSVLGPTKLQNESELIARLRNGDSDALGELVSAYFRRVTAVAYHILRSGDTAQDIAQDVFIRLWDHRTTIDATRSLLPLLFTMARNQALNELKHQRVQNRYHETVQNDLDAGIVPSHEDDILNSATVERAFLQLSERRQFAVRLRIEHQLSHAEIAQILELTPTAAERLVQRGLEDLRHILKKDVSGFPHLEL